MSRPRVPSHAGEAARAGIGRRLAAPAIALALLTALAPPVARAQDAASSTDPAVHAVPDSVARAESELEASTPRSFGPSRAWLSAGPFFAPSDPDHWSDPRGTVAVAAGAGMPVAPDVLLGLEGLAWFASYGAQPVTGMPSPTDRMHGDVIGLGPVCRAGFHYGGWVPWASASVLVVNAHVEWPASMAGADGEAEVHDRWKATFAVGAGVHRKLWHGGGLALRYVHVPLTTDFGAVSRGSANAGLDTVMLEVFGDGFLPGLRGADATP